MYVASPSSFVTLMSTDADASVSSVPVLFSLSASDSSGVPVAEFVNGDSSSDVVVISTVTSLVVDAPAARSKSGHVIVPVGASNPPAVALTNAISGPSSVSTSAMPVASENPMFIIVIV